MMWVSAVAMPPGTLSNVVWAMNDYSKHVSSAAPGLSRPIGIVDQIRPLRNSKSATRDHRGAIQGHLARVGALERVSLASTVSVKLRLRGDDSPFDGLAGPVDRESTGFPGDVLDLFFPMCS
jgi:hypothetical protein